MHHGIGHMVRGGGGGGPVLGGGRHPPPPDVTFPPDVTSGHQMSPPPTYGNYGQCAGGTYPTGMHTCFYMKRRLPALKRW